MEGAWPAEVRTTPQGVFSMKSIAPNVLFVRAKCVFDGRAATRRMSSCRVKHIYIYRYLPSDCIDLGTEGE